MPKVKKVHRKMKSKKVKAKGGNYNKEKPGVERQHCNGVKK